MMKEIKFLVQKISIKKEGITKQLNDADNINQNLKNEKLEWEVKF